MRKEGEKMKKNTATLSTTYMLFLGLLFLSGSLKGILSAAVYYSAFVIPFAFAVYRSRGERKPNESYLTLKQGDAGVVAPVIAPTVSVIMLISYLTSLIIFIITGRTNQVDIGNSFFPALLSHAFMPAILEEMLFRYLPIRLLAPYSRRGAIIISAVFFSLVHHDFFSIPYAFVAGLIFMAVDLASESVIPSVIIHFINNALSVGLIFYSDNPVFAPIIYCIVGVLTVVSAVIVFARRREYEKRLVYAFDKGEKIEIPIELLAFASLSLSIAVVSLL